MRRRAPSVRGPRAQCDKKAYQFRLKATCERQERLDVKQGHIAEILVEDDRVTGVSTQLGVTIGPDAWSSRRAHSCRA